jgi:outer membrane protein TolC
MGSIFKRQAGANWRRPVIFGFAISCVASALSPIPPVLAQDDSLTLGATVESVREAGRRLSPELRAATLETDAAAARTQSAGALDDPMLRIMSDEVDRTSGPRINKTYFTLEQEFPLWGKRHLKRSAALAALDAARGQEKAARSELDENIMIAFARYYVAKQSLAINVEVMRVSIQMARFATARYSHGLGDQSDALAAMTEQTKAGIEAERLKAQVRSAAAHLNALLARPLGAPLAEPLALRTLPHAEPSIEALLERVHSQNPMLLAQSAEIEGANAERRLAARAWYPDVTLGGGAIQRDDGPAGYTASIALKIPLQRGAKAAGEREASAKLGAAQARLAAMTATLQGDLEEALASLTAARRARDLYQDQLLPQIDAAANSALARYGRGKGDLAAVLESDHRRHTAYLEFLQNEIEAQAALASIERMIGGDL